MPYRPRRLERVLQYCFFTAAGLLSAVQPSVILTRSWAGLVIYAWVLFLLAGSVLCLIGTLRNSWLGEYLGLPLMSFALGGYGLLAFGLTVANNLSALTGSFLYVAVALGFLARLREVNRQRKMAVIHRPPRT